MTFPSSSTFRHSWLLCLLGLAWWFPTFASAQSNSLEPLESFVFATPAQRQQVLRQLVPGTQSWYVYHALHALHQKQWKKTEQWLQKGLKRFPGNSELKALQGRTILKAWNATSAARHKALVKWLQLRFSHMPPRIQQQKVYPSRLNPEQLTFDALLMKKLRNKTPQNYYSCLKQATLRRAIARLLPHLTATGALNPKATRLAKRLYPLRFVMLNDLKEPDMPRLSILIVQSFQQSNHRFGRYSWHHRLTFVDLQTLAKKKPSLLRQSSFVNALLKRWPRPSALVWKSDRKKRLQSLQKLWDFARTLPPVQASLKLHVAHQLLKAHEALGQAPLKLFQQYLSIPRNTVYSHSSLRRSGSQASLYQRFSNLWGRVGNDEPLVRRWTLRLLRQGSTQADFSQWLSNRYLRPLVARARLTSQPEKAAKWMSMLKPAELKKLRKEIQIQLLAENRRVFGSQDPIRVKVALKNVKTLLVKIYRLNPVAWMRKNPGRDIPISLSLAGLKPLEEKLFRFQKHPLKLHTQTLTLNSKHLQGRGVYLLEMLGGNRRSRALIRKGRFKIQERFSYLGHIYKVYDENNKLLTQASIWRQGKRYTADPKSGEIVTPLSSSRSGSSTQLVEADGLAEWKTYYHRQPNAQMKTRFFLPRESLLPGRTATLLLRSHVTVAGVSVPLELLSDVQVKLTMSRYHGASLTRIFRIKELHSQRELAIRFRVPAHLKYISATLSANIRVVGKKKPLSLSNDKSWQMHSIASTSRLKTTHLRRTSKGFVLELRSRTGRLLAGEKLHIRLSNHYFGDSQRYKVQTDQQGRVHLGFLSGHYAVEVRHVMESWRASLPIPAVVPAPQWSSSLLVLQAGKSWALPFVINHSANHGSPVTLQRLTNGLPGQNNEADLLRVGSTLHWKFPTPGHYLLRYELEGTLYSLRLHVVKTSGDWHFGQKSIEKLSVLSKLQLKSFRWTKTHLVLQWKNIDPNTRIHVLASAFEGRQSLSELGRNFDAHEFLRSCGNLALSDYRSNRSLGSELLYIFQRRYAQKFPGNPLLLPSLLLNPWAPSELDIHGASGSAGSGFGTGGGGSRGYGYGRKRKMKPAFKRGASIYRRGWPDFAWHRAAPVFLTNLLPNKKGELRIPKTLLKGRNQVQVLGLNSHGFVSTVFSKKLTSLPLKDIRQKHSLPLKESLFSERKVILLKKGQTLKVRRLTAAKLKVYASLADVFHFYTRRTGQLKQFSFLLNWQELSDEKKLALYSKFACHELNFFLYRKDRPFFDKVIQPYLKNKWRKTFLDRWLLGMSLQSYLQPWAYSRLNVFEKILLAQRFRGERQQTLRWIRDLHTWKLRTVTSFTRKTILNFDDSVVSGELRNRRPYGYFQFSTGKRDQRRRLQGLLKDLPARLRRKLEKKLATSPTDSKNLQTLRQAFTQVLREQHRYTPLEKTKEWVEQHYWKKPLSHINANLLSLTDFWKEYAAHNGSQPFLPGSFWKTSNSLTARLLALAVLDLPFKANAPKRTQTSSHWNLQANSSIFVAYNRFAPTKQTHKQVSMVLRHRCFAWNSRKKGAVEKFEKGVRYRCEVLVHNPTAKTIRGELLLQLPKGSLRLSRTRTTWVTSIRLGAYQTRRSSYSLYFPQTGRFEQYPPTLTHEGVLLGRAKAKSFQVVPRIVKKNRKLWSVIAAEGSNADVMKALESRNLNKLQLWRVAWRMKNKAFFLKVIALLHRRHHFDRTLWSYSFYHKHPATMSTWLRFQNRRLQRLGAPLSSPLLTLRNEERPWYEHKEYSPLVLPRAHSTNLFERLPNKQLKAQYHRFLKTLRYTPTLTERNKVALVYYLLLQNRIREARLWLQKIQPTKLAGRVQWDYLRAYFDFFNLRPKLAVELAKRYKNFPIARWRKRFRAILAEWSATTSNKTKQQHSVHGRNDKMANKEPSLSFKMEGSRVLLRTQNLKKVTLRYYLLEPEVSFTKNPFASKKGSFRPWVAPHLEEVRTVGADGRLQFNLPAKVQNQHVFVEAVSGSLRRGQMSYSHSLDVRILERAGRLQVRHLKTGKRLPVVYVKVYAKFRNGKVKFYRDGYTDLRGRFDYSSVSGQRVSSVRRFSVLVLHPKYGAIVHEVTPPRP